MSYLKHAKIYDLTEWSYRPRFVAFFALSSESTLTYYNSQLLITYSLRPISHVESFPPRLAWCLEHIRYFSVFSSLP